MNANMKLWNQVCETDPQYTQHVNQRGGFTAIDSQYQIMKATELWGPYGEYWGLRNLQFVKLSQSENCVGMSLQAEFFYPATDTDNGINRFPIAADMPYKPNDECLKKLQTQCISKALSRLGFNADVFLGRFDDNMYVESQKKKFGDKKSGNNIAGDNNDSGPDITITKKLKQIDPTPNQAKVLGKLAAEYDIQKGENSVVDYKLLCKVVYNKYGKYPGNAKSIPKILNEIQVGDVTVANDFLKGIDDS